MPDLRLDAYLDAYGGRLTPAVQLELVRQLAEAVRYARNREQLRLPGVTTFLSHASLSVDEHR
ncbi:hypothetical protein [Streptomyces sp. NPDC058086]|uniref:hypothetical protein n=1 Tax=Streptomyces sp. NPDC058086 TaxID=3346334 RepID=UPI0036E7E971